jgi:hypothetical protein
MSLGNALLSNALLSDEHAQTSGSEHGAGTPLGPRGPPTAQKRHARLPERDAGHPPPESVLPRARHGKSLPRCGELTFRTPTRHRAPNREPGRILIPGDGAAGDQRAQHKACLTGEGGYATPAACPVSTTSWRYGLRRTCRLVTGRSHRPQSAWPDRARLALLAVTHRYKRAHCLWLEQFQIDAPMPRQGIRVTFFWSHFRGF